MGHRLRLFVAIILPEELKDRLGRVAGGLAQSRADVRWVPKENLHVTVKVLAEVDDGDVMRVVSSLKEAAGAVGRGRLEVHGLGAFPNLAAPRVVYAGLRGDVAAVTTVHARLDAGLAALGIKPEGRGYVPHITLGRVRSAKHTVALTERLKAALDMDLGSFSLEAFTLMESHLSPEGPEYVVAATVPI